MERGEAPQSRSPLERRARVLLWAYPYGYRAERGAEMLDTLIEAAPAGRTWPTLTDAGALLWGGLRVRTAQNRRLATPTNWRLALLLALVLYVAPPAAQWIGQSVESSVGWHIARFDPFHTAAAVFTLLACVLVWCAPSRFAVFAAVIAAASAAVSAVQLPYRSLSGLILAAILLLMAVCARGRDRMPRSWLWLVAAPMYVYLHLMWQSLNLIGTWELLAQAVAVVVLLWMIFDARPILAVAVYLILTAVVGRVEWGHGYGDEVWYMPFALAYPLSAAAILLATWRVRRQAVL